MSEQGIDDHDADDAAPGWDAIDGALEPIYGNQEPKHFGTVIKWMLGGPDPLDGISAFKRLEPIPHWHFISYGLTELYEKDTEDLDCSGYGFELTFRLACDADESEPPHWPMNLMQNLARYVFQSGNIFQAGHWVNLNGPIALERDTQICSVAFVDDPELAAIDTPHGWVEFLQIVGLTQDEEDAGKLWNARGLIAAFEPYMPLYITDITRGSMMARDDIRQAHAEGMHTEGSSTGQLYTDILGWETNKRLFKSPTTTVDIGAGQVAQLVTLLPARLSHGKDFTIVGKGKQLIFKSSDSSAITTDADGDLIVMLTPASIDAIITTVKPLAESYAVPGMDLTIRVQQTNIRDANGNVVETIG